MHDKVRNGKIPVGNLRLSCTAFVETVDKSENRLTKGLVRKKVENSLRWKVQAPLSLRTTWEFVVIVIVNYAIDFSEYAMDADKALVPKGLFVKPNSFLLYFKGS